MIRNMWIRLVLFAAGAMALAAPAIADTPSFTLRYGVLAGLTGDPAPSGQGWNEAARLGIDSIAQTLKSMGLNSIQVVLANSQDSQGNPQAGVEAAQKLVQIDHVNVIIGDFYSSVTTAVADRRHHSQPGADLHRRHQPRADKTQYRPGAAGLAAGRRR